MAGMSEGTCTRYRCRGCGEEWTWRNTQEGRNAYARTNRQHDGELVPIGTEYRGLHRADEGGVPWPEILRRLWCEAQVDHVARVMGVPADLLPFGGVPLDIRHEREEAAPGVFVDTVNAIPTEYTDAAWLGPKPGAQWVDHEGQPITTDER